MNFSKKTLAVFALATFSFAADLPPVKDADGNAYPVVQIGNQQWMAANLRVNAPNSNPAAKPEFGRHYLWKKKLNVCPAGWHIPTADDWKYFSSYIGANSKDRGKALRSKSWLGQDQFGFNALPSNFSINVVGERNGWLPAENPKNGPQAIYLGADEIDESQIVTYAVSGVETGVGVDAKEGVSYSIRCVRNFRSIVDERDGQSYEIKRIGTQKWLTRSITYKSQNSRCFNGTSECPEGRLYNARESATACPAGTRLPTKRDWEILNEFMEKEGYTTQDDKSLYLRSFWWNGSNLSGFAARFSGAMQNGQPLDSDGDALFWSTTQEDNQYIVYQIWWIRDKTKLMTVTNTDGTKSLVPYEAGGAQLAAVPAGFSMAVRCIVE